MDELDIAQLEQTIKLLEQFIKGFLEPRLEKLAANPESVNIPEFERTIDAFLQQIDKSVGWHAISSHTTPQTLANPRYREQLLEYLEKYLADLKKNPGFAANLPEHQMLGHLVHQYEEHLNQVEAVQEKWRAYWQKYWREKYKEYYATSYKLIVEEIEKNPDLRAQVGGNVIPLATEMAKATLINSKISGRRATSKELAASAIDRLVGQGLLAQGISPTESSAKFVEVITMITQQAEIEDQARTNAKMVEKLGLTPSEFGRIVDRDTASLAQESVAALAQLRETVSSSGAPGAQTATLLAGISAGETVENKELLNKLTGFTTETVLDKRMFEVAIHSVDPNGDVLGGVDRLLFTLPLSPSETRLFLLHGEIPFTISAQLQQKYGARTLTVVESYRETSQYYFARIEQRLSKYFGTSLSPGAKGQFYFLARGITPPEKETFKQYLSKLSRRHRPSGGPPVSPPPASSGLPSWLPTRFPGSVRLSYFFTGLQSFLRSTQFSSFVNGVGRGLSSIGYQIAPLFNRAGQGALDAALSWGPRLANTIRAAGAARTGTAAATAGRLALATPQGKIVAVVLMIIVAMMLMGFLPGPRVNPAITNTIVALAPIEAGQTGATQGGGEDGPPAPPGDYIPPAGCEPKQGDEKCCVPRAGYCSLSYTQPIFGPNARGASQVCKVESGGYTAAINEGCLVGRSAEYSVGLFQINMLVTTPPGIRNQSLPENQRLNSGETCNQAFGGWDGTLQDHTCFIANESIFTRCRNYLLDPVNNIAAAKAKFDASGWQPWTAARREWNGKLYCDLIGKEIR
ncbi:MAG: hypothetical protein AAB874_07315 [Patescibacteria group bacterium]